jgi:hypothetical protein
VIATPRFVFLHLHKSGGTFVNECLLRCVPQARMVHYHWPRSLVPPELSHLPALGLVRNPWSYYVSWYSFQAANSRPNALFQVLSDGGRLNFESTIRNMLNLGSDSGDLDRLVRALPQEYTNRGLNLPGFALAPIRGSGLGFYSYLYEYMYDTRRGDLHVGHMENLREDLLSMLRVIGQPIDADMDAFLRAERPRNVSRHVEYGKYYGEGLRDLVAERDAAVIARHGYRFA